MQAQWPDESMFRHFTIFEETFKSVNSTAIKAAILIPKNTSPVPRPIILNFHGGYLIYGHSLFAPFFSPWVLKLALEESAVVVSPDYRLLPSENGVADQLEDLEDFWQWTRNELHSVLEQHEVDVSLDFARLLLTGSSAGGYCAVQVALSHPEDVAAMAMAYPAVDFVDDVMVSGPKDTDPTVFRFPLESLPSREAVISWIEGQRRTVTIQAGMERTPFAVAAVQYGLFYSHVFDNKKLKRTEFLPLERIRAGARLPPNIWIVTGDDDSIVYLRTIQNFVDLVRQKLVGTNIRLDIASGEDHAFDLIKTTWELHAIGAMEFVKKSWVGT